MPVIKPKAVFFDWDGTAVYSRKAPADHAIHAMRPLLAGGVRLVIVSGTTIENIAGGCIEQYFTPGELKNLYLGLGRGAYNYAFDHEGKPYVFADKLPDQEALIGVHNVCFDIHKELLKEYDYPTDIVFSRPNYCKLDLIVSRQRGDQLFLQEAELMVLKEGLKNHGIQGGVGQLMEISQRIGAAYGIAVKPTCDAKYLEVGLSSKSDNVDTILKQLSRDSKIQPEECCFWGDEYVGIEDGLFGSDSFMITETSRPGRFFDVSEVPGQRPEAVTVTGGGVERFLGYLRDLNDI